MRVTRLRLYPVKSFAGVDVGSAEVLPWGLAADRRWGVIDGAGQPVTGSTCNALLGLTAEPLAGGGVRLSGAQTITRGPEPIRTLSKHRKWDGKTWFGIRLIPESQGVITVGDVVRPV